MFAPTIDWDRHAEELRQGDLSGLDARSREMLKQLAGSPELAALAKETGIAPELLAVAVLGARDAARIRSADRVFRALVPKAFRETVLSFASGSS
jgi:hypothetical protein